MTWSGPVRAGALVLGVAGAAMAASASPALAAGAPTVAPRAAAPRTGKPGGAPAAGKGQLTFKPIPPNRLDTLIVPNGYDQAVVVKWGDPVVPAAPAFDVAAQTAEGQSKQFGYNNDFAAVLPLDRHGRRALLVTNHEYTNEELMLPGFTSLDALSVEQLKVAMAAHGMSVVEVQRVGDTGQWELVRSGPRKYNRRFTALATKFELTGPARQQVPCGRHDRGGGAHLHPAGR